MPEERYIALAEVKEYLEQESKGRDFTPEQRISYDHASKIAKLSAAALDGTARQPEAANDLRTSMIIPAALIEGLGFFALVVCLLIAMNFGLKPMPSAAHGSASAAESAH